MDYTFCYITKSGNEIKVDCEIDVDSDGGCVGCGVAPCYHCKAYPVVGGVDFSIGGISIMKHNRQVLAVKKQFEKHTDKAMEEYAESCSEY